MKNIILISSTCLLVSHVNAQVSIGPVAGAHITHRLNMVDNKNELLPGEQGKVNWKAGANADIHLIKRWSLQTGILFAKNNFWDGNNPGSAQKNNFNSIEVPVNVIYKTRKKNTGCFFFSIGPYFSTNIKRYTITYTDYVGNIISQSKFPTLLAAGANFNIGYQFKSGFFARAHYQQLFTNMLPDDFYPASSIGYNVSLTYYNYGISAGYLFKLGKKNEKTAKIDGKSPSDRK